LKLKDVSPDICYFCGRDDYHEGCPMPYLDNVTIRDILNSMLKIDDNISFYHKNGGKKDLVILIDWDKTIPQNLLDYFTA